MKNTWISAIVSGLIWGIAVIAVVSLIVSFGLSFYSDPLHLLYACALVADFAGGFAAAVVAALKAKEKPLPVGITAGLVLSVLLLVLALIGGNAASSLLPLGLVMGGSVLGGLAAPAISSKKRSKYGKLIKN